jgi:hypothetical protein
MLITSRPVPMEVVTKWHRTARWQMARRAIRSKVALAISAGGNFGRAPDNRRPRGYDLRGPQRLPLQGRARHQRRREFRSAPDNRRPRGYLGSVRWGCPWRSPKTLAVSGGVGRSFWRRVHLLRASPRRLSYRRAGPLVPQSSPASRLPIGRAIPCHCAIPCHFATIAIGTGRLVIILRVRIIPPLGA